MSLAKQSIRCPYCREPIAEGAIRCRHCHVDLVETGSDRKSAGNKLDNFRVGFLSGLLFLILVELLVYFQFFAGK